MQLERHVICTRAALHAPVAHLYILVCLILPNTSLCPDFAMYVLFGPVSLKLLAAGEHFWVLYSFCVENVGFLPLWLIFHPKNI